MGKRGSGETVINGRSKAERMAYAVVRKSEGVTNSAIAEELGVSRKTITTYFQNIPVAPGTVDARADAIKSVEEDIRLLRRLAYDTADKLSPKERFHFLDLAERRKFALYQWDRVLEEAMDGVASSPPIRGVVDPDEVFAPLPHMEGGQEVADSPQEGEEGEDRVNPYEGDSDASDGAVEAVQGRFG